MTARILLMSLTVAGVLGGLRPAGAKTWTLRQAVEQATTESPDARIAQQRVDVARAALEQADAAFWPQAILESSATRTDIPMLAFGAILNQSAFTPTLDFNDVPATDNLNVRGTLRLPLFAGGANLAQRQAALAQTEASEHQGRGTRNALALTVAQTFQSISKLRAFVEAMQAQVESLEANLAIAARRHAAGTLLKTDVLDLEVRLSRAREELLRAANARRLTTSALRHLLGVDDDEFDVSLEPVELEVPAAPSALGRPERAASAAAVRAARAGADAAQAGYFPRLEAVASLNYDYGFESDRDELGYLAGVTLSWPVWDGLLTRGRVREAEARVVEAREQERKTQRALEQELERARVQLDEATERVEVNRQAVASAASSAELTRARFEQGFALASNLIDAEAELTNARVRLAEAEADRLSAVAALRTAAGLSLFAD